jgi:hypothetical protein
MDDPARLRRAQYLYLTALCHAYMGNTTLAKNQLTQSVELNREHMLAVFFERFL